MNADRQFAADVLISGGLIQAVGADLEACLASNFGPINYSLCSSFALLFRTPCCCLVFLAHLSKVPLSRVEAVLPSLLLC